jgi:hypothetical protein
MKLTESCKREIIRKAINATFADREKKIKAQENSLAETVYHLIYTEGILCKMKQLPDGFFNQESNVYIGYGSETSSEDIFLALSQSHIVSANDKHWNRPRLGVVGIKGKEDELIIEARKIGAIKKKIDIDTRAMEIKLRQFLAGITTWKKLEEIWPEGKEYFKLEIPAKSLQNPPAI